jgi:diguanylate cyclase (GGDEF)-like protein
MTDLSVIDDSFVGIILCDIDGMRLINESLGHDSGNALLVAAATSVRWTLPPEAIVARIGSDEFGALLLGTDHSQLEDICQRILMSSEGANPDDPRLRFTLSVGCAAGIPAKDGIFSIFKAAEAKLHRQKLTRSLSSRDMIFQTLQKALEKRDFLTHQHATRIWALALPLAQEAGLSARRLDNLKLLAQFHDIGKVGIPDNVLFKEGPLTDEENEQARLHAEIGYRIALSMPDLFPVADLILKHHEWWNGQGYPLGIKGEEIPLECRIFNIVDAFDSMTNDRPDRKAMSDKEAAAELRNGAGSQFDPYLIGKFLDIISP